MVHIDQHAILLDVALGQAELFDLDFTLGVFVLAEDDGEGDGGLFGGFELRGQFGFEFVREFGLLFFGGRRGGGL